MSDAYSTVDVESQSWANIGIEWQFYDGPTVRAADPKAVKWKNALEVGTQRMTSGAIKGYTRGQATPDGSMEFYAGGLLVMLKACIAVCKFKGYVDGSGAYQFGRVVFDVPILHTPYGETEIRKVKLIGCRIKSDAFEGKEGQEVDASSIDLIVTRVERTIGGDRAVLL